MSNLDKKIPFFKRTRIVQWEEETGRYPTGHMCYSKREEKRFIYKDYRDFVIAFTCAGLLGWGFYSCSQPQKPVGHSSNNPTRSVLKLSS